MLPRPIAIGAAVRYGGGGEIYAFNPSDEGWIYEPGEEGQPKKKNNMLPGYYEAGTLFLVSKKTFPQCQK